MSKKKKIETATSEDIVAFNPGASTIDIASLKASMKEDTDAILEELDSDPELKKDVLDGFETAASDAELENIGNSVQKATDKQTKEMAKLAKKVAKDLSADLEAANALMIEDDKLLEQEIAAEMAASHASEHEDDTETEDMSEEAAELKAALPQLGDDGQYNMDDLQSCIEALLFYSDKPVSLKKLKEMLEMVDVDNEPLLKAIELLKSSYASAAHGFEVAEIAGGYQLRTKASKAPLLRKLSKVQVQRLSKGAMESLTIVAYKQPCTKDDIDQVRGVDSSHFIRTLMDRNLIEITGRSESPGRPMIYATTSHFLEVFNMMDTSALPPLREIEAMVPQMAAAEEGQEDPRVVQMRKLVQQMKEDKETLNYDAREDEILLAEIRERVKTIDITTPYLARQKALADEGIVGAEADEILAKEFGLNAASSGGETIASTEQPADKLAEQLELSADELTQIAQNISESDVSSDEPQVE